MGSEARRDRATRLFVDSRSPHCWSPMSRCRRTNRDPETQDAPPHSHQGITMQAIDFIERTGF
jgi:hypothetical protein